MGWEQALQVPEWRGADRVAYFMCNLWVDILPANFFLIGRGKRPFSGKEEAGIRPPYRILTAFRQKLRT